MTNTAGFYKFEDNILRYAQISVYAPNFTLKILEKDFYTYPVFGWRYFESTYDAEAFYGLNGTSLAAWDQFSLTALADPGLNLAVLTADSTAPNAARGLSAALLEAKLKGEYVNFAACWASVVAAAQIPSFRVAELVGLAQACLLPQAFIDAISPP
jgi:hypothetical protein